jgi:predicted ester cyclase
MSTEENKATVLRYFEETHGKTNLAIVDELCTPEYAEGRRRWLPMEWAAFPDTRFDVHDVVAEGDRVVVRWTMTGTHRGECRTPLGAFPPTGRRVEVKGLIMYRLEDGQLAQEWLGDTWLSMLRQLGAEIKLPTAGEATRSA